MIFFKFCLNLSLKQIGKGFLAEKYLLGTAVTTVTTVTTVTAVTTVYTVTIVPTVTTVTTIV